jgi:hypothetical protein
VVRAEAVKTSTGLVWLILISIMKEISSIQVYMKFKPSPQHPRKKPEKTNHLPSNKKERYLVLFIYIIFIQLLLI